MNAFARFSRLGAAAVALAFALGAVAVADEVNSTRTGLILRGGIGTGQSMFGVINNTTGLSDLGSGKGQGLDLGALANYQFFAFGLDFTAVKLKDLDWSEAPTAGPTYDYTSSGGGYYWTLDATLGAKIFTEPGDMGYTHLFMGLRVWKAVRDEESRTSNGVTQAPVDYDLAGNGWIIGIRDFSTIPLGGFSLVLQSGLWFSRAPMSTFKVNGADRTTSDEDCFGIGLELGIGAAMESLGFSVVGGLKTDIQVTTFRFVTFDCLAGAGYLQFFLVFKKEFAL